MLDIIKMDNTYTRYTALKIYYSGLVIFLSVLFVSCHNSNSEAYIQSEHQAIHDLIPTMTDLDNMISMNNLDANVLKLLLVSTLDTSTASIIKPMDGYFTEVDGVRLSEDAILENQRRYKEDWEAYELELRLFSRLIKAEIETRPLIHSFEYSNLKVQLVSSTQARTNELSNNEFGYLRISRILFNRSFTTGYLSYSFYCGQGCVWDNNIEIEKVNGKWTIVNYYSGGIA